MSTATSSDLAHGNRACTWLKCLCGGCSLLVMYLSGCGPAEESLTDPADDLFVEEAERESRADSLTTLAATGPLRFGTGCVAGESVSLAMVGDILLHKELQVQAYPRGFDTLWAGVAPFLREADITYGNHEGPSARGITASGKLVSDPGPVFDDCVYTSFPQFHYHASLAPALVRAGFDVVSTANNHALGRYSLGADRTLDSLNSAGLRHAGTVRSDGSGYWSARTSRGTMEIRWLACTFGTNGIEDPNRQVLRCYSDAAKLESLVRSLSSRSDVDAVIVTPHWGQEYTNVPEARQITLAHRLLPRGRQDRGLRGALHAAVHEPRRRTLAHPGDRRRQRPREQPQADHGSVQHLEPPQPLGSAAAPRWVQLAASCPVHRGPACRARAERYPHHHLE